MTTIYHNTRAERLDAIAIEYRAASGRSPLLTTVEGYVAVWIGFQVGSGGLWNLLVDSPHYPRCSTVFTETLTEEFPISRIIPATN